METLKIITSYFYECSDKICAGTDFTDIKYQLSVQHLTLYNYFHSVYQFYLVANFCWNCSYEQLHMCENIYICSSKALCRHQLKIWDYI